MSRGHGKWERAILAALEQAAAFYLTDLLPTPHTRSQVVALNRAARNLAATDKIRRVHGCSGRSVMRSIASALATNDCLPLRGEEVS